MPAWDPRVELWDVIDNAKMVGRFYLDMHPRPGKYSHAEMAPVLDGIRGKQLPEAVLVCNFPEPTATDPGLMDYGDVVTFFHEFGHLMHHILAASTNGRESAASPWKRILSRPLRRCSRSGCTALRSSPPSRIITRPASRFLPIWWAHESCFCVRARNLGRQADALSAISYDIYNDGRKSISKSCPQISAATRWSFP